MNEVRNHGNPDVGCQGLSKFVARMVCSHDGLAEGTPCAYVGCQTGIVAMETVKGSQLSVGFGLQGLPPLGPKEIVRLGVDM